MAKEKLTRKATLPGEDGRATARFTAGELRVASSGAVVKQVQSRMKKYKKPGVDVVDEFLRDRRAMWGEKGGFGTFSSS